MPPNTVYVGRPSKWGNPYDTAEEFRMFICLSIEGGNLAYWAEKELRGKNLACWCRLDQPCHADILLEIANK